MKSQTKKFSAWGQARRPHKVKDIRYSSPCSTQTHTAVVVVLNKGTHTDAFILCLFYGKWATVIVSLWLSIEVISFSLSSFLCSLDPGSLFPCFSSCHMLFYYVPVHPPTRPPTVLTVLKLIKLNTHSDYYQLPSPLLLNIHIGSSILYTQYC